MTTKIYHLEEVQAKGNSLITITNKLLNNNVLEGLKIGEEIIVNINKKKLIMTRKTPLLSREKDKNTNEYRYWVIEGKNLLDKLFM